MASMVKCKTPRCIRRARVLGGSLDNWTCPECRQGGGPVVQSAPRSVGQPKSKKPPTKGKR